MWLARTGGPEDAGWVGNWSPGIGDPTLLGWATVLAYFGASWLCYNVSIHLNAKEQRSERLIWRCFFVLLIALGINKQLDLQTAFTVFFRSLAHEQGWYSERRAYQRAFIEVLLVLGALAACGLLAVMWRFPRSTKLAGLGLGFIGGYVLIRATSLHGIDRLIHSELLSLQLNWIFELGGIGVLGIGAGRRVAGVAGVAGVRKSRQH